MKSLVGHKKALSCFLSCSSLNVNNIKALYQVSYQALQDGRTLPRVRFQKFLQLPSGMCAMVSHELSTINKI